MPIRVSSPDLKSSPLALTIAEVEAGEAFEGAGLLEAKYYSRIEDLQEGLDLRSPPDCFNEACKAYSDVLPLAAARCLEHSIKELRSNGRASGAAKLQDELGDLYMSKCNDADQAIAAWQKAGNWYRNDRKFM